MSPTLVKALVVLLPMSVLFSGSVVLFFRRRTVASLLQILGAGCLVLLVLTHVAEALQWFPSMHWGDERSIGHYLDLASAVLGATFFPVGYLLEAVCGPRSPRVGAQTRTDP
jgi:hypothetical protein